MTLTINGTNFTTGTPASMSTRFQYEYTHGVAAVNGQALNIYAGKPMIKMKFPWLTSAEWAWWGTTILGGSRSKVCSSGNTVLYNDDGAETTWSSCIIDKPVARGGIKNGLFRDVEIVIRALTT